MTKVPVAVVQQVLNLMDPKTMPLVYDTIKQVEDKFGMPVGGITFDTFPKGIAAGGGEENSAKDVNMAAANLRRRHEKVSLHVALIGHTGKDESRGSRGSNANQGDWDVDFRIARHDDHVKTLRIEKANDQEEGQVTAFKLKPVKIGIGEDLENIMTSIVDSADVAFEIQDTPGEQEDMLHALEVWFEILGSDKGATLEDLRSVWKCSDKTARRRAAQLKKEGTLVATEAPGRPTTYKLSD